MAIRKNAALIHEAAIGCSSLGGCLCKANIAKAIQTAYDMAAAKCTCSEAVRLPDEQRAAKRFKGYSVLNSISNTLPSFNSSRPR